MQNSEHLLLFSTMTLSLQQLADHEAAIQISSDFGSRQLTDTDITTLHLVHVQKFCNQL